MVYTMEVLFHARCVANWTAGKIQPDSVFRHHPDRLDPTSVLSSTHLPDRIAIKALLLELPFLPHGSIPPIWGSSRPSVQITRQASPY